MGALTLHLGARDADLAALGAGQAHDKAQRRRLAHAIAADQADHFARSHLKIDPGQHLAVTVRGFQATDFEERFHDSCSSPR